MRVLLACLHFGLIRNFESVVAELAGRGHEVVLASEESDWFGGDEVAAALQSRSPMVRIARVPSVVDEAAVDLGQRLRLVLDHLRFLSPEFQEFSKLRERMPARLPYFARRVDLSRVPGARRALAAIEQALPASPELGRWLEDEAPGVVLLASLTHSRSIQPALLRVAIDRRIPSIACIHSWDHLSSKAHIIDVPDRVFVWNQTQKAEAVRLHGLPADRVEVTGAQCYDQWFDSGPARDRETFCRTNGLDPARPFVLYTCSALTPSPDEPAFVMQWIERLRRSDRPALRELGVLLRPHPERVYEWDGVNHGQWENVVFRPRSGDGHEATRDYLDALHHSVAVVGVVTSAFLEAAIIGRPVLTPMLPAFAPHQWGAQHFRYLLEIEGGLPIVARTLDEHFCQLDDVVSGSLAWRSRQERFLSAFVRAGDLQRPATPRFVDAVERVAAGPSTGYRRHTGIAGRSAASIAVSIATRPRMREWLHDEAERGNALRKAWEGQNRQSKEAEREQRCEEKERQRRERVRQLKEERQRWARVKRDRYRSRDRERQRGRIYALGQRVVGRVRRVLLGTGADPPKTPKTPGIQS